MAYCVDTDIQQDFPGTTFTETSKVKLCDLSDFIVDADALINSYLAGRYVVPVVSSGALPVLKLYSRSLVSDKVKGLLEIKQQTNATANQNVRTGLGTRDIIKLLEDLRDGKSQLVGAALVVANGGISSFNVTNNRETKFKTNEDQW